MGIAKDFNNVIESQINVFAAWLPVTNTFKIGDYGIFSDGVFTKMGNIKDEFGIDIKEGKGPDSKIDFSSEGTSVFRFAAGAQVDVIPSGAVDAKVTFKFEREKSFLVKSPVISVDTMENVNEVGKKLIELPDWENRFKVVYQTYFAKDAVVISTVTKDTEINFSGDVTALQQLNVGSTSVEFNSKKELGLSVQGKEGVIGLGLFQIKRGFLGLGKEKPVVLSDEEAEGAIEMLSGEVEDDL
ncbi:hypothetical protein [Foetidibacter luteolus]|uniref:hypothetical protein n=1 Tax=Foetidibacter luteolus TaxID=2608880 RepID=UPI00129B862F|nr:hypothetical protein [Foetidibacter luteolus]